VKYKLINKDKNRWLFSFFNILANNFSPIIRALLHNNHGKHMEIKSKEELDARVEFNKIARIQGIESKLHKLVLFLSIFSLFYYLRILG